MSAVLSSVGPLEGDVDVDTRYSPEQLELRRSAAALVADLGPKTVDDLDDAAGASASPTPRRDRAGSSSAVRARTTARSRRGSRSRSSPRELGRGAADTPFLGPVVAVDLARQAGLELEDAARERGARRLVARLRHRAATVADGRGGRLRRCANVASSLDGTDGPGQVHASPRWRCPSRRRPPTSPARSRR